jgi:hypothetical protein
LADNDRPGSEAGLQSNRSILGWNFDLAVESASIALGEIWEVASHIGSGRTVVTIGGKAPNLEGETLDNLLGMERPPGNGNEIFINDVVRRKVDDSD